MKATYGDASILKNSRVVFNIGGNKYRIVVRINYPYRIEQEARVTRSGCSGVARWLRSERFDVSTEDALDVQERVARQIVAALGVELGVDEERKR